MKLTKQQLKQIIKEELGGVVNEYDDNSHLPGYGGYNSSAQEEDELPQGQELDQALNPSMPSDIPALQRQIQGLYDSVQGLDPHARYGPGQMSAIQKHLIELEQLMNQLRGEFQ